MYLGEPKIYGLCCGGQPCDEVRISIDPGLHMLCDVNGTGLYLDNVKNGTLVTIKTADAHFSGKHFLVTSPWEHQLSEYFEKTKQTTCKYHIQIILLDRILLLRQISNQSGN